MTEAVRVMPWPTRLAAGSAAFIIVLGLAVLAGWFSNSPALIQILPHLPPMTRNTAACFMLSGIALLISARRGRRWVVVLCAGLVNILSVLATVEIAFRVNTGVNELLGTSYITVGLVRPGGMAPVTAFCFALASMALLLAPRILSKWSALLLGLNGSIVAALGMATSIGFLGDIARAAIHTAVGLWVLGFGMLALAWRVEADPAGAPRWLPVSVAIGAVTITVGLWQALVAGGHARFALLPAIVLVGGCLLAPIFGLTVYLAQRAYAQAADLLRNKAFLTEAQRLSRTGSFSWLVATDEITWSDQLHRIFELEQGLPVTLALIGTRIHPEDVLPFHEMLDRARGNGGDFEHEHRLQMPDRSIKYLHMVAHGARDQDGRLEFIGAVRDVTERRLSDEALAKARSELAYVARVTSLGALTASIAHEVNQPLSGIIVNASTCLRMLAADPPNIDGALETARRTIRDGHRAASVVTRLRALFSRKRVTTEVVDLNEAAREVIALSRIELQRNRVTLRVEFSDDLPSVTGDRVQLQQVILNLLLNASEAMSGVEDRPRRLTVRTERDGDDRARLTVQDAGVGFAPQDAESLFEAFHTTKRDGMGIGLSVSRYIVESHHGQLWAAPNDGPGAAFSFSIPHSPRSVIGDHSPGAIRMPIVTDAGRVIKDA